MERLTNCAQGYCEMYCKKYMLCFEDPEDCIFKDEIKLYDAVKSIEGIVPFERLLELACADKAGQLVVLPCKVGDTIYYTREGYPIVEPLKVRTFFVGDPTRRGEILHLHMIRTDKFDVSMDALGKTVFLTREEAEAALAGKGGKNE